MAISFARIHAANLINSGIMPLVFENPEDYEKISEGDVLTVKDARNQLVSGKIEVINETKGFKFTLKADFTEKQQNMLLSGGLINMMKGKN